MLIFRPFSVGCTNYTLAQNASTQIHIEFQPMEVGDHQRELVILYDTGLCDSDLFLTNMLNFTYCHLTATQCICFLHKLDLHDFLFITFHSDTSTSHE